MMEEIPPPFPYVDLESSIPQDGTFLKTPLFCSKSRHSKCSGYYEQITDIDGFHTCPYGFSSYVVKLNSKTLILTGIRISGHFDRKKIKRLIAKDFAPVITIEIFQESINKYFKQAKYLNKFRQLEKVNAENVHFINNTLHEIRKLNREIKAQVEQMNRQLDCDRSADTEFFKYRLGNIFANSTLISVRLNAYDASVNPQTIYNEEPKPISIYKKFEKVKHCLSTMCARKRLTVEFLGKSFEEFPGYEIFELLPFLLFENAIKFSPENEAITVRFNNYKKYLEVIMYSKGPALQDGEADKIFDNDYRGYNAMKVSSGTGFGLYFAKIICDINDISIQAK